MTTTIFPDIQASEINLVFYSSDTYTWDRDNRSLWVSDAIITSDIRVWVIREIYKRPEISGIGAAGAIVTQAHIATVLQHETEANRILANKGINTPFSQLPAFQQAQAAYQFGLYDSVCRMAADGVKDALINVNNRTTQAIAKLVNTHRQ